MLRLSRIVKDYKVANTSVKALKGVSLSFRKSEFVSILGPSGCGKTTLLNIIGGLDKYTSGDLCINGRSTREFKDSDWDIYRNHRVGFVFQSYNLIPHQTILGNVELALTIAGIPKNERVRRAKQALDQVGLKGQYNKKPNQLSGGQCQRVAIARALVNDPEILLADEPTGALDSVTSEQIMALIKKISNDRLVIMVTHNPEIAEKYSTRIIKLLDGEVVDDNNPFSTEEEKAEVEALRVEAEKKQKELEEKQKEEKTQNGKKKSAKPSKFSRKKSEKAKMSFWTAFKLSAQNLFTKKARTILTSIAGAIGIIGVSLVLSISNGVKTYINDMQNDMLSGNPIAISQTAMDLSAIMDSTSFTERVKAVKKSGLVNVDSMIDYLVQRSGQAERFRIENDITEDYVEFIKNMPRDHVASIYLNYGLDVTNNIYTSFKETVDGEEKSYSLSAIKTIYTSILKETEYKNYAGLITSLGDTFMQAPSDDDYILSQYNVLTGSLAKDEDEVMIVVSKDRELTDLLLTQLGYFSQDQFMNIIEKSTSGKNYDPNLDKTTFNYDELLNKEFTYFKNDSIFTDGFGPNIFNYKHDSEGIEGGQKLKVVGILEPKDDINYGCLQSGFFYTEAFAEKMISDNKDSKLTQFLLSCDGQSFINPSQNSETKQIQTITYQYNYTYNNETKSATGYVGSQNLMSLMGTMMGGTSTYEMYTLTAQQFGGSELPYEINIYPNNFDEKQYVLDYLDKWNSDEDIVIGNRIITAEERNDITYTDNISVIINMVNNLIDIVTYALVGFTALSLVVSCVMIAIITYVSVVERIKEIGVIRSLGGRKRDVAYLFNAETFIIGLASGLIGIGVTYLLSFIANIIVSSVSMLPRIAIFPWHYALIMVAISIILTLISGLIPSMSAARKDPVNALRTE